MSLSRCTFSKVDYLFFRYYQKLEYVKDMSSLVQRFEGQLLPELGPSLVILRCKFSHLYLAKSFDYWACDCNIELHLLGHDRGVPAGSNNVRLFAITPLHRPSHYI